MIEKLLIIGLYLLSYPAMANIQDAYNEGMRIGETLPPAANPSESLLDSFKGTTADRARQEPNAIPEKSLNDAALVELNHNPAGTLAIGAERERAKFESSHETAIEHFSQPIVNQAPLLIKNQRQDCIEVPVLEPTQNPTQHSCEVSRAPEEHTCIRYLKDPTVTVIPAKYSHFWCAVGRHRPDDPSCRAKTYYNPAREYQAEQIITTPDEWVSQCETLAARPECRWVKMTCVEPNAVHIINEKPITRPCWKEQHTYSCQYPSKNNCAQYHRKECQQIGSRCQFTHNDKCYIWEHQYECLTPGTLTKRLICGKDIFCINGDCHQKTYPPNEDFLQAMSELSVFHEIQKTKNEGFPEIFRGSSSQCKKDLVSFKSCCKIGGWGKSLGLTDCNEEEKSLAQKRDKLLCHEIGEYCSKRLPVTNTCIEKKTTFCCFGSKLMRILHEQGRGQAGIGWGEPKEANCRGFTVEELSRIDFSRLNFGELFADIRAAIKPQNIPDMHKKVQERLQQFQAGLKQGQEDL